MTLTIAQNFESVRAQVAQAAEQSARDVRGIRLIAVSKTVDLAEVAEAIECGAVDFGENRPDELLRKYDAFPHITWHFIGNIQSRRLRDIVGKATYIHSLHEISHARKIDEIAQELGIVQNVLVEVHNGEEAKQGVKSAEVADFIETLASLPHLQVCGLMIMAPFGGGAQARDVFASLRALRDELMITLEAKGLDGKVQLHELSMGMSGDFKEAIAQGATMVRIGRALFS